LLSFFQKNRWRKHGENQEKTGEITGGKGEFPSDQCGLSPSSARLFLLLQADTLKQDRCRLVLAPLPPGEFRLGGDQPGGECQGEDGLPECISAFSGGGDIGFDPIGESEEASARRSP